MALSFIKYDQEHEAAQFRVNLIRNLVSSKGLISEMFSEMEPAIVLVMLKDMGEDDAISYMKREKKRISTYIESKQVPLKFKKMMSDKKTCADLLVGWFISILIKEKEVTKLDFQKGYDYPNEINTNIKVLEKLVERNDHTRAYIALGCLIGIEKVFDNFTEREIERLLKLNPTGRHISLVKEYLDKIKKRVQEGTVSFRERIIILKEQCESLSKIYDSTAVQLREYTIDGESLAETTKELTDSFNDLKAGISGKFKVEGIESIYSIISIEQILDSIDEKNNEAESRLEAAREILEKASHIKLRGDDYNEPRLKSFKDKITFLKSHIDKDHAISEVLLSGNHPIPKLLQFIEKKQEINAKEMVSLLIDLQTLCGYEDSNIIVSNLTEGNITFQETEETEENLAEEMHQSVPGQLEVEFPIVEIEAIEEEPDPVREPKHKDEVYIKNEGLISGMEEEISEQPRKPMKREGSRVTYLGDIIPSSSYAAKISASYENSELENLLWSLIYEDDLAGAYWLAKAIEFRDGSCAVASWMIMAILGARWISSESGHYVENLLEIAKAHKPGQNYVDNIFGLAASIRPALIQPDSGLIDWLQRPQRSSQQVSKLVDSVREFSKYGRAIMPEDVMGAAGSQNLSIKIADISASADRWLKESISKKTKIKIATEVWRNLTGNRGVVREILKPVVGNDRERVQSVKEALKSWQRLDYIERKIDDITEEVSKLRSRKIVGSPRQNIIRNIGEAFDFAYSWCQLIDRENEYKKKGSKLNQHVRDLQKSISECASALRESFGELTRDTETAPIASAFACFSRSVEQVFQDINLGNVSNPASPSGQSFSWIFKNSRDLQEALGKRLILVPEYTSSYGLNLVEESKDEFFKPFCNSIASARSLEDAISMWFYEQDYRFLEQTSAAFDQLKLEELKKNYKDAVNNSDQKLKEVLSVTSSNIEQALVDGVIREEQHSKYNDTVQSIELSKDLNYRIKNEVLNGITSQIESQREERLDELKNDWNYLQRQMDKSSSVSLRKGQVSDFVEDALSRKDTRVVEECLAHLKEVFDKGINLEESLFKIQKKTDHFEEFLCAVPKIKSWIENSRGLHEVVTAIQNGITKAGINYGELPKRKEITSAINSWMSLKKKRPNSAGIEDNIAAILRFMGFIFEFQEGIQPIQVQRDGLDWVLCTAHISAGEASRPIPQFGSLTRNRYDIICLWERPGMDTIAARLRELRLTSGSVIVLFLGRMYDRQRRDLVRISRDKTISAALLDEILLIHLTRERDATNRLPMFLRCSLPYTSLNPYTPFQAGDVPPEMFFGRVEMINELQRMGASCIVYGGRQLGKSALLRRVQREFHNPHRDQYATVVDIKLLGDPKTMQPTWHIWGRIREKLRGMGFFRHVTTDRPEEIRKNIRDLLNQNVNRKLIILCDEADNFLETDAKDNFIEVNELRTLMLESGYRFKVVFAGLQNVARFQGIPNQPLAHFGTPIRVGPLEADAAKQLVSEPLDALGYRMENDRTTILRILSYTNYHPGLIQLFCQELLKRLEGQTGNSSPPFTVKQVDVEAVYRLDEVRQRIRERFDWTLALNSRYQAIAWLMVLDQLEKRDSYSRTYPPGNILSIARDWWAEGFGDLGLDKLRSLLDEMCGLGVLVRNSAGHYRLRSPNLVRLLGTDEDILNNLAELSKKKAPSPFDADDYHVLLDENDSVYSPLTYFQERNLNKQRSGTSLIFSSNALGLLNVKLALKKFVSSDAGSFSGLFTEMPAEILSAETFQSWISKHIESNAKIENLLIYKSVYEMNSNDMATCIGQAIKFCNKYQSRKKLIRIFFVFDPEATWEWLTLPGDLRREIEESSDSSIYTRKWNREGIKQRLANHDKINKENFVADALNTSNGWPYILDTLFERCGSNDDIRPFLAAIDAELKEPDSILRNMFLNALGFQDNPVSRSILNYLKQFDSAEPVPIEFLEPDCIEILNKDECSNGIEFLERMNCIEIQNNTVILDPIVRAVIP